MKDFDKQKMRVRDAAQKKFCDKYGFDDEFFVWFQRAMYGSLETHVVEELEKEGYLDGKV